MFDDVYEIIGPIVEKTKINFSKKICQGDRIMCMYTKKKKTYIGWKNNRDTVWMCALCRIVQQDPLSTFNLDQVPHMKVSYPGTTIIKKVYKLDK